MKTPREILLERHQNATPKLDTIRRKVMNATADMIGRKQSAREFTFAETIMLPLRQLLWPHPKAWAGLAVVWIFIFVLNFSMRDKTPVVAEKVAPPSPEVVAELRQQQRLFAELIGSTETRVADRQKLFLPRPRSEHVEILTA